MIAGISHITLIVEDLQRSSCFLTTVFNAKEVYTSQERRFSISNEIFFLIENVWICIMKGDSLKERTYNHIAFKISEDDFDSYVERIRNFGVDIHPERSRLVGEGRSIYFYDFDNHLFELHTGTLEERLDTYSRLDNAHKSFTQNQ